MQDKKLIKKVIGAAMNVHEVLGTGFDKTVYQKAFQVELSLRDLNFEINITKEVFYKKQLVGLYTVDVMVEGIVAVTILNENMVEPYLIKQAQKVKDACTIDSGLVLNFGQRKLKIIELE